MIHIETNPGLLKTTRGKLLPPSTRSAYPGGKFYQNLSLNTTKKTLERCLFCWRRDCSRAVGARGSEATRRRGRKQRAERVTIQGVSRPRGSETTMNRRCAASRSDARYDGFRMTLERCLFCWRRIEKPPGK